MNSPLKVTQVYQYDWILTEGLSYDFQLIIFGDLSSCDVAFPRQIQILAELENVIFFTPNIFDALLIFTNFWWL